MQKRSLSVTIFGWMFILGGLSGFFSRANFKGNIEAMGAGAEAYIMYILSVLIAIGSFIGGIYLLKLEVWARKLIIVICLANIVYIPFLAKTAIKLAGSSEIDAYYSQQEARIIEELKPEYQQEALENLSHTKQSARQSILRSFTLFAAIAIFWNLFVIYFFRRPKIKAQFKERTEGCCAEAGS